MRRRPMGTVINGKYRLEAILGRGGMGAVYLATHLGLGQPVALKEMDGDFFDPQQQDAALRQFRQEAQILHELRHPRLPRVHDFFILDDDWYLVMDYIRGRPLSKVLEVDHPLSEEHVLKWAGDLCDVLEYLHGYTPAIVFRDLKPSNIILDVDGEIRLIDFGISKLFQPGLQESTRTYARHSGTPGFAAPEQYEKSTDPRSDIYSLGATLYALLAGRAPVESLLVVAGVVPLEPLGKLRPDVGPRLLHSIEQMMQLHPEERPQSIAQVRDLLAGNFALTPVERRKEPASVAPMLPVASATPSPAPPPPARPTPSRRPAVLLALACLILPAAYVSLPKTPPPPVRIEPATLQVVTTPPGAAVFLDQHAYGTTPLTVRDLSPARYRVHLQAAGLSPVDRSVTLSPGTRETLDVALTRATGTLGITASPEGADVFVDGTLKGMAGATPVTLQLASGSHTLLVRHPGCTPSTRSVEVVPDATATVAMTLVRTPTPVPPPPASPAAVPSSTPSAVHRVVVLLPNRATSPASRPSEATPVVSPTRGGGRHPHQAW